MGNYKLLLIIFNFASHGLAMPVLQISEFDGVATFLLPLFGNGTEENLQHQEEKDIDDWTSSNGNFTEVHEAKASYIPCPNIFPGFPTTCNEDGITIRTSKRKALSPEFLGAFIGFACCIGIILFMLFADIHKCRKGHRHMLLPTMDDMDGILEEPEELEDTTNIDCEVAIEEEKEEIQKDFITDADPSVKNFSSPTECNGNMVFIEAEIDSDDEKILMRKLTEENGTPKLIKITVIRDHDQSIILPPQEIDIE